VKGIRRLFLPRVGNRGSVKHLFEEFQNSLWDRRESHQDVPQEGRASDPSRLHGLAHGERKEFLKGKFDSPREVLCEILSEESCAEWLGFNDLARLDTKPHLRRLAGLVREPDWTDAENIHNTFKEQAEWWLKEIRAGRILSKKRRTQMKPAKIAGYESAVTWLNGVIGDKPLPDVKNEAARELVMAMKTTSSGLAGVGHNRRKSASCD
jgi:hypothetical protein